MKRFVAWICALMLMIGCIGDLTPVARAAETSAAPRAVSGSVTYYVSTSGKGGNNGLSAEKPFPGLDAVPWDQLLPGDSVLLKKDETFPGTIRMVDVHGTADDPITIGAYGDGAAPVIEARGQGIWLPETGNDNGGTPGRYVSSGVTLYDCSYVTVKDLTIVNVPDTMKSSFICADGTDRSGDKMTYSGIGVAADDVGAVEGITLTNITVRGNSELVAVKTDTSSTIATTGVTTGATATARTYTDDASGTYYVSSLNGSDSNDGSSPDKAFYSLHKINELNLKPGAKVYLEYGSVFENQYLHVEGGGSAAQPIIIDAYGVSSVDKPLINTNGNGVWYQNYRKNLDNTGHLVHGYVSSCVLLYDVPYIEVKNIAMTNFGRYGETEGADFENLGSYDGGTVPGETGYAGSANNAGYKIGCYQWGGKMSRTGVAGLAQNKGTVTHTVLQNLDIENIYGNVAYKHMDNGGIYFTASKPLNETDTGVAKFDDLRIEGCYLKRVSRWGIAAVHTAYWQEISPNGQKTVPDAACQQYGATNVYIGHNYLEEVGGDPITAMHAYEPFVEYNVSYNGGREMGNSSTAPRYMNNYPFAGNRGDVSAGIWPWKCKTALFEHNECYTMLYSHLGANNDCQPWDADSGDSTIYQYNYSSGNTGGCIMFCAGDSYNTVFRYNISYKDGMPWNMSNPQDGTTRRGFLDPASAPNGQIYNNTFVVQEGTPVYHYTTGSPIKVENNIFYNLGNTYAPEGGWNAASGPRFVKNIYVGFAQTGEGTYTEKDTSPITLTKSDALFAGATFDGAPEEPASTSKNGVRMVNGVRDWTHDWASDFDMFKLDEEADENKAINAGLPHNYDCLVQDGNFGVPRVDDSKDFYGNDLDDVHDIGAFDTQTASASDASSECELVSSLYELRGAPKTELQVPLGGHISPTVETFLKGLTASDGATIKVYNGDTEVTDPDTATVTADMTVKVIAENGTDSTTYTIASKPLYNSHNDWVDDQQGNVWFYQQELDGVFTNHTSMGKTWKDWSSGTYATMEQNQAVGDINNSIGSGFTFRAPVSGKVTISFNYHTGKGTAATGTNQICKRAATPNSKWQTYLRTYHNDVEDTAKAILIPMNSTTPIDVTPYTITVAQGDTLSFIIRNEERGVTTTDSGNHGVYYNPVITYVDAEFIEPDDVKAPTAPSGVRATDVGTDGATITWTASTDNVGVTGYKVKVGSRAEEPVAETTKALTGLTEDTEYTVTVKAVDAAGNESEGSSVTFHTAKAPDNEPPSPPGTPESGNLVGATQTTATIAWTASTDNVGVEGYEVTLGDGEPVIVRNATQVTLTGLTAGDPYEVTVKAFDAAGKKSSELRISFNTESEDNTPPAAPTGLVAFDITKDAAALRWMPSADEDVVGYKLQVDDGEKEDVGNVFQHPLIGLDVSTTYTVKVWAVDESGNISADCAQTTFETLRGSSECELLSSLYEISDTTNIQVPYTERNPMTVERFRTGLEVSEDATVKVFGSDGSELSATDNVAGGMTVKIVAQNGTINSTTYTIVQKNTYNSYVDWVDQQQGTIWRYQHENETEIVDHTTWNPGWHGWGGESPAYKSVQQSQACGAVDGEQGSGYTFCAPADGMVQISFWNYLNAGSPVENQVQKRENTSSNTLIPYIRIFVNGTMLEKRSIQLEKHGNGQTVPSMTFSVKQGDKLSFLARNEDDFTNKGGNNGIYFNPVLTYQDAPYVPDPTDVTVKTAAGKTTATIYTNTTNTADRQHTVQLVATVEPADAGQTVEWSSSNANIATVEDGLVTAVGKGTVVISATATATTGETVSCDFTVYVLTRIESIAVQKGGTDIGSTPVKVYVNQGDAGHPNSVVLTTVPTPADPTHPALKWTPSGDFQDIISIDEKDAANKTSVTITATGGKTDVGRIPVRVASADHPEVYTDFAVEVFRYLENNVYVVSDDVADDAKVGSTLTASTVELEMTTEAKAALQYQWYRGEVSETNKIEEATGRQYTVTEADIGETLYVTVTADPTTFYEGVREAHTDWPVAKMAGPAAPTSLTADNCTAADTIDGKINGLDGSKLYEYKLKDAATWTQVTEGETSIIGLAPGDYLVRIQETDTVEPGKTATVTILSFADAKDAHTITIDPAVTGGTIEVSASQAAEGTEITVTVTPDTGYELVEGSLTVTDSEEQTVTVTGGVFEMPAHNVTITAQFVKKTFTITHAMENVTCSLDGAHEHTVDYGYMPTIIIRANEGYTMPDGGVQVTYVENGVEKIFRGYEYSRSASNPDAATLTFTKGIDADLTVSATIPEKTLTVNFNRLTNGLSAPVDEDNITNARTVKYGKSYTGKLTAVNPNEYKLPKTIQILMGGESIEEGKDFVYDGDDGTFTITRVTGDLTIIASGVDVRVNENPVSRITLTPDRTTIEVGKTVKLTVNVTGVDPSKPATNPGVIWGSDDDTIATVVDGVVTGVTKGTVTIRATSVENGARSGVCQVTVNEASSGNTGGGVITPLPTTTTTTTTTNPDGTTTTTVTDNKTGTVTETTKKDDGTVETVETKKDGTKTETTEKPDGTVEVVETKKDGTVTETTKNTDGSTEVVETKPDGTVTETNTDAEGGKVEKVTTPEKDVAITVTDAEGEVLAKVELPAEIPAAETRFVDVPVNHWADEAIHNMAALEVVEGVGDNRFDMNSSMTRGALATVLSRMSDGQKGIESSFADVASDKWYADGIAWAAKTGVVTGYSATEFGPNDPITREQLAVMLCRYARLLGMDTAADSAALGSFKDGSSTHSWAADSIAWCVDKGILKGMGNETLAPTATATRAQVAVMLQRFIDLVK